MDTWSKYKYKTFSKNQLYTTAANIAKELCYANYLIAKYAYLASKNKIKQKHINLFC